MCWVYFIFMFDVYPAAQFPLADPPLLVHSLDVKQVPLRTVLKYNKNKVFQDKFSILV